MGGSDDFIGKIEGGNLKLRGLSTWTEKYPERWTFHAKDSAAVTLRKNTIWCFENSQWWINQQIEKLYNSGEYLLTWTRKWAAPVGLGVGAGYGVAALINAVLKPEYVFSLKAVTDWRAGCLWSLALYTTLLTMAVWQRLGSPCLKSKYHSLMAFMLGYRNNQMSTNGAHFDIGGAAIYQDHPDVSVTINNRKGKADTTKSASFARRGNIAYTAESLRYSIKGNKPEEIIKNIEEEVVVKVRKIIATKVSDYDRREDVLKDVKEVAQKNRELDTSSSSILDNIKEKKTIFSCIFLNKIMTCAGRAFVAVAKWAFFLLTFGFLCRNRPILNKKGMRPGLARARATLAHLIATLTTAVDGDPNKDIKGLNELQMNTDDALRSGSKDVQKQSQKELCYALLYSANRIFGQMTGALDSCEDIIKNKRNSYAIGKPMFYPVTLFKALFDRIARIPDYVSSRFTRKAYNYYRGVMVPQVSMSYLFRWYNPLTWHRAIYNKHTWVDVLQDLKAQIQKTGTEIPTSFINLYSKPKKE